MYIHIPGQISINMDRIVSFEVDKKRYEGNFVLRFYNTNRGYNDWTFKDEETANRAMIWVLERLASRDQLVEIEETDLPPLTEATIHK